MTGDTEEKELVPPPTDEKEKTKESNNSDSECNERYERRIQDLERCMLE